MICRLDINTKFCGKFYANKNYQKDFKHFFENSRAYTKKLIKGKLLTPRTFYSVKSRRKVKLNAKDCNKISIQMVKYATSLSIAYLEVDSNVI